MPTLLLTFFIFALGSAQAVGQERVWGQPYEDVFSDAERRAVGKIIEVGNVCDQTECTLKDAVFFVHGLYGDDSTFRNNKFDWPSELKTKFKDRIDVYKIQYQTQLLAWLKKDIASFDEVVDSIFWALQGKPIPNHGIQRNGLLARRPYRSIAFVAHSLGGNVVAAYLHTVKSELGHAERAQNSFLVTLGTPANGSQMANAGVLLKNILGVKDPLLGSLTRDNTFVRMLARWRNAEDSKATRYRCRPVNLYVGVEAATTAGLTIVSKESAEEPYRGLAKEVEHFAGHSHSSIAKPTDAHDPVFVWVSDILTKEVARIGSWPKSEGFDLSGLCDRLF